MAEATPKWVVLPDDDGWPEIETEDGDPILVSIGLVATGLYDANQTTAQIVADHNAADAYRALLEAAEAVTLAMTSVHGDVDSEPECPICTTVVALRAAIERVKGEGA